MIFKPILLTFLNEPKHIFIFTELNSFSNFYLIQIILLLLIICLHIV